MMPLGIVLGLIGLFATAVGVGRTFDLPLPSLPGFLGGNGPMHRSDPTRITIPDINVRADVVTVGQAGDGSIGTPDQDPVHDAGWYKLGPSPGESGTAVIVGHVDTKNEPAVFARISELKPGAKIEVRRSDWRVATFKVDSVSTYPKTSFPASWVYASSDRPRLALITCGGKWVGGSIGYANNIIVMASFAH